MSRGTVRTRMERVLSEEGVRGLWFRGLGAARIYRRLALAERPLSVPIPNVSARVPIIVSMLEPGQVDAYLVFRPDQDPDHIRHRLAENHWCFAVWQAGRIVHVAWAGAGRPRIEYLARDLEVAPDEVYVYDAFTSPDFRGLGASPARSAWMLRFLRDRQYRCALTAFLPDSPSAWRPLEKVGYRRIGVIGYVGIGSWRHDFWRGGEVLRPGKTGFRG